MSTNLTTKPIIGGSVGSTNSLLFDGYIATVQDDNTEAGIKRADLNNSHSPQSTTWVKMAVVDSSMGSGSGISPMKIATVSSWAVNWLLLVVKIAVVIMSSSKAVLAAMVDSAVDLVSQAVLSLAGRYMQKHSPYYPVGRSRLEALSVITCAFIMTMASIEVIQFSAVDIYDGIIGDIPQLDVGVSMYAILGLCIFLKLILYLYCRYVNRTLHNDMLDVLAEDHFNDVISNTAAIITAAIAFNTVAWWVDPAGAILISIVIIGRWIGIMAEQVKKIVGHTAPPEFITQVEDLARLHDSRLAVDVTRAYHFGARYNVEMEIVLPG